MAHSICLIFAAILGLCWGSFLNVVAYRSLRDASLFPRSKCPSCYTLLGPLELIPVISWLLLRGRCKTCGTSISAWYPAIELITALWLVGIALYAPASAVVPLIFFGSAMIIIIRTDGEELLIPSPCTLGVMASCILINSLRFVSWSQSLLGAAFGWSTLEVVRRGFRWIRGREGMGDGDPELLAAIGSCLGPIGAWLSLVIGSFTALCYVVVSHAVVGSTHDIRSVQIPLGLFLAASALIVALWYQKTMILFLGFL